MNVMRQSLTKINAMFSFDEFPQLGTTNFFYFVVSRNHNYPLYDKCVAECAGLLEKEISYTFIYYTTSFNVIIARNKRNTHYSIAL